MSAFKSENAYREFDQIVKTERRWIFDGKAGNFLAAVRAASKSLTNLLKAGRSLYRAQVGSELGPLRRGDGEDDTGIEEEHPLSKTRMIPDPKHIKSGGRANPSGFAYLYLADRPQTALAEMRPSIGESLTVAQFKILKNIKLVVCRVGEESLEERLFEENPSADKIDKYVWNDISRAFAQPMNREDKESAYIPTQILAEAFKAAGFDGIVYQSGLERGTNVVLFDRTLAKPIRLYVYTLKKVRYDFEAVSNYCICRKSPAGYEYLTEIHTEPPQ